LGNGAILLVGGAIAIVVQPRLLVVEYIRSTAKLAI